MSTTSKVIRTITAETVHCDHPKCDATVDPETNNYGEIMTSAQQLATEVFEWVHIAITGGKKHISLDLCREHAVDNVAATWLSDHVASASEARR